MDISEWEILSDDGFLDGDEEQLLLGKRNSDSISVFDKNYFRTSPTKQLVHFPIQYEEGLVIEEKNEKFKDPPHIGEDVLEADQDTCSQVFFQIKENKFVDMKLDSPRSSSRGFFTPGEEGMEIISTSPRSIKSIDTEKVMDFDEKEGDIINSAFNFWKWSLTGVGAICSFGVAAATICVLFFGTQQRNKSQQDQKIRFQIYTDDKRIKQVVQHATKLNEAFAAVRGVPLSRAHITYSGYYDGL